MLECNSLRFCFQILISENCLFLQTYPNDRKYTDNMDQPRKNNKPVGRGKPRPKSGGDFNHVQVCNHTDEILSGPPFFGQNMSCFG